MARRETGPDFIEALARGLDVIRAFGPRQPVMSLAAVAAATGLARPTARRILRPLPSLVTCARPTAASSSRPGCSSSACPMCCPAIYGKLPGRTWKLSWLRRMSPLDRTA